MRVYIASDLHIGSGQEDGERIIQLLEEVEREASLFIGNGDVIDLWRNTTENILSQPAHHALVETANRVPTVLIRGNHDWALPRFATRLGLKGARVVTHLAGDGYYFAHGWRFAPTQRLLKPIFPLIRRWYPYIYQRFAPHPRELKGEGKEDQYVATVAFIHFRAIAWAQRKRYRAIFLGHTHCPTSLRIRNQELWDSGDFVDSFSYIILENGRTQLHFL